jgi:glycosyltransferase involved in cell wall biosynthesis
MLSGRRICVVMPAYRAEKTLRRTCDEIDRSVVDDVLIVDDASPDGTARFAAELGLPHVVHPSNRGYGGTQKTCYTEALARGADIVVMLHADYQYSPRLVPAMAGMIASGHFDVVLGSRILGTGAREGGMPLWKYVANRGLTVCENVLLGANLSEYHTGFRAFAREVLETLPLEENSDDFVFDNQILAQAIYFGFRIGEISCPTRYFPEASTIGVTRSIGYGFGVLRTALEFRLARLSLLSPAGLRPSGRRLTVPAPPSRSSPGARAVADLAPPARAAPRRPPPP